MVTLQWQYGGILLLLPYFEHIFCSLPDKYIIIFVSLHCQWRKKLLAVQYN